MKLRFPGETYCIDTSALIDLAALYPRDVFPSLWDNMEGLVRDRRLISPREVLEELKAYKGDKEEPRKWANAHLRMFKQLDGEQLNVVADIVKRHPDLIDLDKPVTEADPFVIALAATEGGTVVTSEKSARVGQRSKIPDVCAASNIPSVDLLEYFRVMGWTL